MYVQAVADLEREGGQRGQSYPIELTVTIDIADCNFGGPACDPVVVTNGISVVDNDIPYLKWIRDRYNTGADWSGPTNVTTTRTFDANSTTLNELADVVGTLISDLRSGTMDILD